MAQPAAVEEEHTRFISSSAIEWTTKPVTGFLEVCNEPILCSEVILAYDGPRYRFAALRNPSAAVTATGRRGCATGTTWGPSGPFEGEASVCCTEHMDCHCTGPHSRTVLQVNKWTRKVWAAVLAEFVGMAIFEIYGGNAPDSVAAYGNGITLGILGKVSVPY